MKGAIIVALGIAAVAVACASGPARMEGSDMLAVIRSDYTLSGTVRIRGTVKVLPGAVLTIAPGAKLLFEPYDPDRDGVNDSALVVEGGIVARGEPDAPIIFTSASPKPAPGDWLEVRVEKAEGVVLQYCVLEYARNGLHAHFSSGVIADCFFRHGIDAGNFGRSRFTLVRNALQDNEGTALSLRESSLLVSGNSFLRNRTGILFFEKDAGTRIFLNRFAGNGRTEVRIGDFFAGDRPWVGVNLREDGGGVRLATAEGEMEVLPSAPHDWMTDRPAVHGVTLVPLWEKPLGSFIDAGPVAVAAGSGQEASLLAATWGGELLRLTLAEGREIWRAAVGEVIDSPPLATGGLAVVNSWDRRTRAFRLADGTPAWERAWPESAQDDHRQAAPVAFPPSPFDPGPGVLVGMWNGDLACLERVSGEVRWRRTLDGAVRAAPLVDAGARIWAGTDAGTLYNLGGDGSVFGTWALGSPLRTSPVYLGPGWDPEGRPVAHGAAVLVCSWDGTARVMDDAGKGAVWRRETGGAGTYAEPQAFGGGAVFALGDGAGAVTFLGRRGELLAMTRLGSAVHALGSIVERDGAMVLAGTETGGLYLLAAPEGDILASAAAGAAVHGKPLYDAESRTLVFGARDGILRAYRVEVKETPWEGPK